MSHINHIVRTVCACARWEMLDANLKHLNDTEWSVWCVKTMYEWMDLQHMEHMYDMCARRHTWLEVNAQIFSRKRGQKLNPNYRARKTKNERRKEEEETKTSTDSEPMWIH